MVMLFSPGVNRPCGRDSRRRRRTRAGACRMARACEKSSREKIERERKAPGAPSAAARAVPKPRLHRGDLRCRHRCTGQASPVRSRCGLSRFCRFSRRFAIVSSSHDASGEYARRCRAGDHRRGADRARRRARSRATCGRRPWSSRCSAPDRDGVTRGSTATARRAAPGRSRDGSCHPEGLSRSCASARRQRGRGSGVSSGSPASPNARSRGFPAVLPTDYGTTIRRRRTPAARSRSSISRSVEQPIRAMGGSPGRDVDRSAKTATA